MRIYLGRVSAFKRPHEFSRSDAIIERILENNFDSTNPLLLLNCTRQQY